MKYLLVLLVLGVALKWWLRQFQSHDADTQRPPASPPGKPTLQRMVACRHCGTHLPQSDAIAGSAPDTYYCCAEHQRLDQSPR